MQGKVAIVTGGSRGIGRAVALALASKGASVVVNYSENAGAANQVAEEIKKRGGEALAVQARVEDYKSVERMVKEALDKFGRIDILVNNAGIIKDKFLMMMSEEEWKKVLDVNLTGIFNCCKAVSRPMIAQKSGKIINISSVSACRGITGQTNYAASKAGVEGFTRALAKEFSHYGIYVNTVSPGFIESERVENLHGDMKKDYLKLIPLSRFGKPEEVAGVVLFLASDDSSYIQGQTILVDGGMTA